MARSAAVEYASLLRQRGWRVVAMIALVAVVLVALFGGFRKASTSAAAHVEAGKTLDAGALRLTPLRAWVARSQPGREPMRGDSARYLMLQLRVDNRTDSSTQVTSFLQSDVRLVAGVSGAAKRTDDHGDKDDDDKSGLASARSMLRADDHSLYVALPPRLPATVDMVWQLPAGAALPRQAQWRVARRSHVEQTYLTREGTWLSKGDAGTLTLAVDDRLAEGAPP